MKKYISIKRILATITRNLGTDNINESDVIEWSAEALEFIGTISLYEEAVAFVEVKNHQCEVPKKLHSIIQIARNNQFESCSTERTFCPKEVVEEVTCEQNLTCNCCKDDCGVCGNNPVPLDCNGSPLTDYELAYYRPYFDLRYEYDLWNNSKYYKSYFSPVRLATNSFFNSVVCKETNYEQLYHSCKDEYTIINGTHLRFSFQEGGVAIAYLKQMLDEEGYPMVVDDISIISAINSYVTFKIMSREFFNGREGSTGKMQKAEELWQWYCKQAKSSQKMLKGLDEHQNFLESRSYVLPNMGKYNAFFNNDNSPETRKYNG